MTTQTTAPTTAQTAAVAGTDSELRTIVLAALLGVGLIFVAGLSNAQVLHDVAHDTRHAVGFPCH